MEDSVPARAGQEGGGAAAARAAVAGALAGASLAAFVVGLVLGRAALWAAGAGVFVLTWVLAVLTARWRRARRPVAEPRTALARIESRRATSGEFADVPLAFDLTVAPEGGPRFRARATLTVNLVDLAGYPEGRVIVVRYPPDAPWEVTVVERPDEEWLRRAEEAVIHTARETTRVQPPTGGATYCLAAVLSLLAGAAAVVLLNRGPLFADTAPAAAPAAPSAAADGGTTTMDTGTSLLEPGRMCGAFAMISSGAGPRAAAVIGITDHHMDMTGTRAHAGDPGTVALRSLPCDRLPALVREALGTLGLRGSDDWRVDINRAAGPGHPVLIRVAVSGPDGKGSLEADATGRVTVRHPG